MILRYNLLLICIAKKQKRKQTHDEPEEGKEDTPCVFNVMQLLNLEVVAVLKELKKLLQQLKNGM